MTADSPAGTSQDGQTEPTPLWEFVRPAEYTLPTTAVASTAVLKWTAFKKLFLPGNDNGEAPVKTEEELKTLPEARLARLVPPVDWQGMAAALDTALADWLLASASEVPVKFIIGQPHACHEQLLGQWATRHDACWIDAPALDLILDGDEQWLVDWPGMDRLWVLPHLEHCYLRHANGLELVRRFLELAAGGRLGRGLIGCDSWAWAYLQRIGAKSQWSALTLQGFDGERLTRLFSPEACGQRRGRKVRFLNAKSGKTILSFPQEAGSDVPAELNHLAARCRGNFGTALTYWRQRLRAEPDQEEEEARQDEEDAPRRDEREESVWVAHGVEELALPSEKDEDMTFVLHALLLHNGLPEPLLPELLSLPHFRIMALLRRLHALGAVALQGERWTVTPQGYAPVRDHLSARDYLLDDF